MWARKTMTTPNDSLILVAEPGFLVVVVPGGSKVEVVVVGVVTLEVVVVVGGWGGDCVVVVVVVVVVDVVVIGGAGVPVPVESKTISLHPGNSSGAQILHLALSKQSFCCFVVREQPLWTVPFWCCWA